MGDKLTRSVANQFVPFGTVQHDNHGNKQHGWQITCANGEVIDYPYDQRVADRVSVRLSATTSVWDLFATETDLGSLPSPLQTRCERHVKNDIER
jgi:hypothetical protein